MKCPVCSTSYNRSTHIPTNLPCGHTVCIEYVSMKSSIRCPTCNDKIVSWKMFVNSKYPPNLALLDEIEDRRRRREEKRSKCNDIGEEIKSEFASARNKCKEIGKRFSEDVVKMEEVFRHVTSVFSILRSEIDRAEKEVKVYFTGVNMKTLQSHTEIQDIYTRYNELMKCFSSDANKIEADTPAATTEPDDIRSILTSYVKRKEEIDKDFERNFSESSLPTIDDGLSRKIDAKILDTLSVVIDIINRLKSPTCIHTRDIGMQTNIPTEEDSRRTNNNDGGIYSILHIDKLTSLFRSYR